MRRMPWLPESPRTYSPLSQPRQSLQDVLAPGRRKAIGAVLQVKVAVAPESVPRAGARAALGIPEKDEEVHHRTGRSTVNLFWRIATEIYNLGEFQSLLHHSAR